jgi:hypothetical protein
VLPLRGRSGHVRREREGAAALVDLLRRHDHKHLIEATPIWGRYYVIPRWQTVSGSQYATRPPPVCALPDARLLQAMTYTLLEAGEKATSPPIIATQNVVRSDVALYAGGITWVDEEYDEKTRRRAAPARAGLPRLQLRRADERRTRAPCCTARSSSTR